MRPEDLLEFIKDKKKPLKVILEILGDMEKTEASMNKNQVRMAKAVETEDTLSPEILQLMLKNTLLANEKLSYAVKNICFILLLYMQGDGFDGDIARLLIKMGKGKEAVAAMFKAKLKGH